VRNPNPVVYRIADPTISGQGYRDDPARGTCKKTPYGFRGREIDTVRAVPLSALQKRGPPAPVVAREPRACPAGLELDSRRLPAPTPAIAAGRRGPLPKPASHPSGPKRWRGPRIACQAVVGVFGRPRKWAVSGRRERLQARCGFGAFSAEGGVAAGEPGFDLRSRGAPMGTLSRYN
jgi:hypothetical protein